MPDTKFIQQTAVGEPMNVLTDERCRAVISFFQDYSGDSASVELLASVLCDRSDKGQERFATTLHHVSLPMLEEKGIITYDSGENVVQYHGHPELDRLSELLETL